MKEALLSINKYDRPTVLKNENATYTLLMRILLLTPGSIQSHPEMGVGIISRWRYSDMSELAQLELEIERQVSTYLPKLNASNVEVSQSKENNGEIIIKITVDNVVYAFETNNTELRLADL